MRTSLFTFTFTFTFTFALTFPFSLLFAGEPPAEAPPAPVEHKLIIRPWMLPPYLVLGLPRDALDAPSKAISSIPLLNKVFFAPLMVLNTITTTLSWSFTEEGVSGGQAAWVDCLGLARKRRAAPHMRRPIHMRFGPNWRTFGVIYWRPVEAPAKPPAPPPAPKAP